jgi:hypothetical protein
VNDADNGTGFVDALPLIGLIANPEENNGEDGKTARVKSD